LCGFIPYCPACRCPRPGRPARCGCPAGAFTGSEPGAKNIKLPAKSGLRQTGRFLVLLAGCTSRAGTALCKMHMKKLEISGQITDYAPKTTDYAKSVLEGKIRDRIVYKKREALDSQCTFRMVHLA